EVEGEAVLPIADAHPAQILALAVRDRGADRLPVQNHLDPEPCRRVRGAPSPTDDLVVRDGVDKSFDRWDALALLCEGDRVDIRLDRLRTAIVRQFVLSLRHPDPELVSAELPEHGQPRMNSSHTCPPTGCRVSSRRAARSELAPR